MEAWVSTSSLNAMNDGSVFSKTALAVLFLAWVFRWDAPLLSPGHENCGTEEKATKGAVEASLPEVALQ